jgi:hypothetical protein
MGPLVSLAASAVGSVLDMKALSLVASYEKRQPRIA